MGSIIRKGMFALYFCSTVFLAFIFGEFFLYTKCNFRKHQCKTPHAKRVSSPYTAFYCTKPMKYFIMKGAQLKAGKKYLLSITIPASI